MMTIERWLLATVLATARHQDLAAQSADWQSVIWREPQVRYLLADMTLGGSIEFYRAAAERDHEMGCLEAVRRTEEGYRITNLDQFERKQIEGKTLITRKGRRERISGLEIKLSSD